MILLYLFVGFMLAIVGGAPLGASNIAVITTTAKESFKHGRRIAYGAGLGEVLLAFLALSYSKLLTDFFEMNPWLQLVFMAIFFCVGIFFLFPNKCKICLKKVFKGRLVNSKMIKGFFLSLANPPVLVFWILAISLTQKYLLSLSDMSPLLVLSLFFAGVFLGKVGILILYSKWGQRLGKGNENKVKLYKFIGLALILISVIQGVKFYIS